MHVFEVELLISHWGKEPVGPLRPVLIDRWAKPDRTAGGSPEGLQALRANPRLGWDFACRLVQSGRPWPLAKKKDCHWIQAAVILLLAERSSSRRTADSSPVAGARELNESALMGRVVRAALLALDATVEVVAEALNVPNEVIGALDALFFNVLERKGDQEYIQGLVRGNVPASRAFTFEQAGLSSTDNLLAIAYSGTVEDVLIAAGLRQIEMQTSAELANALRRKSLAAAVAWFTGNPSGRTPPPSIVTLGLEVAKQIDIQSNPESSDIGFTRMGSILSAQLQEDYKALSASVDEAVSVAATMPT